MWTEIIQADLGHPEHADAVVALLDLYARDEMGGGQPLSDYTRRHLVSELRKRPGVHVVLAFAGEEPAGLAICMEGFSTFACQPLLNLHDIVVAPAHRGRGVSKQLLSEVERIARERGCCKVTLEVLEGNALAQSAYRRAGFEGYQLDPRMGRALFWQKKLG
jgi:ribosomal protein S18 acetylase RimI-like enzyme